MVERCKCPTIIFLLISKAGARRVLARILPGKINHRVSARFGQGHALPPLKIADIEKVK
jgi:hypothetical protein